MKQKILFIQQEGLVRERTDGNRPCLTFVPGLISACLQLRDSTDYRFVLPAEISTGNQDDYKALLEILKGEDIPFRTLSGLNDLIALRSFTEAGIDSGNSYLIGTTDEEKASAESLKTGFIDLEAHDWKEIAEVLIQGSRRAHVSRHTNETKVDIEVDLNRKGCKISTGIAFFDHMLEQIPRHGGIGLNIKVSGDLEVDEHHTIEDTGIALGEAFDRALGSKRGIERYGFSLPMDEAAASVLLDFGGRSVLVWKVEFDREYVGEFPLEMARHFFESFCQNARCNLRIEAEGDNAHHKIEAVFKAFARALKMAVRKSGNELPSSKGVL